MQTRVAETFQQVYGKSPDMLVRAPGRANLIGEHTDYTEGFVMPFALEYAVWIAASARTDATIRLHSIDFGGETVEISPEGLRDESLPHWARATQGAWTLLQEKHVTVRGADIVVGGDIPIGAGLSSSAAIEVAMVELCLALAEVDGWSQIDKALLAVQIEHQFLKMPSGVMDQIASAASIDGSVSILDCRSLELTPVAIPSNVILVLFNTMVSHNLADSEYPVRVQQVEKATSMLNVSSLRDATPELVEEHKSELGDVLYRRAKHVVTENQRVHAMKAALEANDLSLAGDLLNQSHASLSKDYEVSSPELDIMAAAAQAEPAVYGARMMGGGFGGSVIALVDIDDVEETIKSVRASYLEQTDVHADVYQSEPAAGSHVMSSSQI